MDKSVIDKVEQWVGESVSDAGAEGVVLGMSGGKDSLVTAALCVQALGSDKVLGVIMPNGDMKDITVAIETCKLLGIRYHIANIAKATGGINECVSEILEKEGRPVSGVTTTNIPPRVRMATLYGIGGSLNYLVANTSNLSEAMTGYTTKWGDNVGDFSPLGDFTKTEVCEIGQMLGLPDHLVYKAPDDGLSGVTDEEKLGVSYAEIDKFIRTGESKDREKILALFGRSEHKRRGVPKFRNGYKNFLEEHKTCQRNAG